MNETKKRKMIFSDGNVVAVAFFESSRQASKSEEVLNMMFRQIKIETDSLYASGNGRAQLDDVETIYTAYGFSNKNGWEQEQPVFCEEDELVWPLPEGIMLQDVEFVLRSFTPDDIHFHVGTSMGTGGLAHSGAEYGFFSEDEMMDLDDLDDLDSLDDDFSLEFDDEQEPEDYIISKTVH